MATNVPNACNPTALEPNLFFDKALEPNLVIRCSFDYNLAINGLRSVYFFHPVIIPIIPIINLYLSLSKIVNPYVLWFHLSFVIKIKLYYSLLIGKLFAHANYHFNFPLDRYSITFTIDLSLPTFLR